jgi:hypothetical protein
MDEEEKERIWNEIIDNNKRRIGVVSEELEVVRKEKGGWRKELVSDLKGFVILLVFWVLFGLVLEFV